jgi:hypothetical protein
MSQFDHEDTNPQNTFGGVATDDEPTFVPAEEVDLDVDTVADEDAEVEDVPASAEGEKPAKEKKEKAPPKRGELPEGYTTPVGLAKIITDRGLYTNRDGEVAELKPQMVYSYKKNAPKDHPFPEQTIEDSLGNPRLVVEIEAGVEWWITKNQRAAERRANAAEKAEKQAAAKAKKDAEKTTDEAEGSTSEDGPVHEDEPATEAE